MSCSVGIGSDSTGWSARFQEALEARAKSGTSVSAFPVDLWRSDWLRNLSGCQAVIWKPSSMGPVSAGFMKERIYHLEKILGKVVVPGFDSVWHFESKIAQAGLFTSAGVPSPDTFASLDYAEVMEAASSASMPIVFKMSHGAAGANVRLIRSHRELKSTLGKLFWQSAWERALDLSENRFCAVLRSIGRPWFWLKVLSKCTGARQYGAAYWQEYIPDNAADLRVNVIGDMFCTGFWRKNRRGDFRASGSGMLDFDTPVPESALRMCLDINTRLGFDTMAYDILYRNGDMLVTEISYGYLDRAVYDVPGVWVSGSDGTLGFVPGNRWPQELWIDWLLEKCRRVGLL